MKDDIVYVKHVLESIIKIKIFIAGKSYDEFMADEKTISAVLHELMIVGEAAARISANFREKIMKFPYTKRSGCAIVSFMNTWQWALRQCGRLAVMTCLN